MLRIKQFVFNPVQENTYVLYNEEGWCAIVDPGCYFGNEKEAMQEFLGENMLLVKFLLNTHCHLDHVFGNRFIYDKFKTPLYLHRNEEPLLEYAPTSGKQWGLPFQGYNGPLLYLEAGNTIQIGSDILEVLLTPGHSPGSICFYCRNQAFVISGDVLFRESIGRTDLPGGDFDTLIQSIQEQLFTLPDEVVVYSGHGPQTTIGYEKQHNPFLHQADR